MPPRDTTEKGEARDIRWLRERNTIAKSIQFASGRTYKDPVVRHMNFKCAVTFDILTIREDKRTRVEDFFLNPHITLILIYGHVSVLLELSVIGVKRSGNRKYLIRCNETCQL